MAVVALPHTPASAGVARRQLVADLADAGVPATVIADAELVLAELIGNAVRHARPLPGGTFRAAWEVRDDHVVVRVTDGGGPGRPVVERSVEVGTPEVGGADSTAADAAGAERGRGLAIVDAVAQHWGADRAGRGYRTWAVIDLTD